MDSVEGRHVTHVHLTRHQPGLLLKDYSGASVSKWSVHLLANRGSTEDSRAGRAVTCLPVGAGSPCTCGSPRLSFLRADAIPFGCLHLQWALPPTTKSSDEHMALCGGQPGLLQAWQSKRCLKTGCLKVKRGESVNMLLTSPQAVTRLTLRAQCQSPATSFTLEPAM